MKREEARLPWDLLAGGAGAGAVAAFVTSPLDVTRTRLQLQRAMNKHAYRGTIHCLQTVLKEEGIRGWYRGFGSNLFALVPHWCLYFTVYEELKRHGILFGLHSHGHLLHLFAAIGAGTVVDVAIHPLWLVKTRMQSQDQRERLKVGRDREMYRNSFHALRTIIRHEGFFSLWNGLSAQLMGLTHVAVQFPLYEHLKSRLAKHSGDGNEKLSAFRIFLASSASKVAATAISYPHEVIRSRLQTQSPSDPHRYHGLRHALDEIYLKEGVRGFYRGITPTLFRAVPSCGITFTLYEVIQRNTAHILFDD